MFVSMQSEHIGTNFYEIIEEDDHKEVRKAIAQAMTCTSKRSKGLQYYYFYSTCNFFVCLFLKEKQRLSFSAV